MSPYPVSRVEAQAKFKGQGESAEELIHHLLDEIADRLTINGEITLIEIRSGYLETEPDDAPMTITAMVHYT